MPDALEEAKRILNKNIDEVLPLIENIREKIEEILEYIYEKMPTENPDELMHLLLDASMDSLFALVKACDKLEEDDTVDDDKVDFIMYCISAFGTIAFLCETSDVIEKYMESMIEVLKRVCKDKIRDVKLGKGDSEIYYK